MFDEFHQQKRPLTLRAAKFEKALGDAIEGIEEENNQQKIFNPKTVEDNKNNKVLYNKKSNLVRSMLRNHFKELKVSQ